MNLLILFASLCMAAMPSAEAATWFVRASAPEGGEIWAAACTYHPAPGNHGVAFALAPGVRLHGRFQGNSAAAGADRYSDEENPR